VRAHDLETEQDVELRQILAADRGEVLLPWDMSRAQRGSSSPRQDAA
jgi:hypothetical protein